MVRLVEKLLLQTDKGEALLLRIYHLKADLTDAGSDLAFLHNEKPFTSLAKNLASVTSAKGLVSFRISSQKQLEELAKTRSKVKKHLSTPLETILDAREFLSSTLDIFSECDEAAAAFDLVGSGEVTKLYLDLVVQFVFLLELLSRIEEVRLICFVMRHCCGQSLDVESYAQMASFVTGALDRPLLTAYEWFKPFRSTLVKAFVSPACRAYVSQRRSYEQWSKEEFLCLRNLLNDSSSIPKQQQQQKQQQEDLEDTGPEYDNIWNDDADSRDGPPAAYLLPCIGYSLGLETIDLERWEKWLFCGFLLCHQVVDFSRRDSGEFRIWTLLLQGMWVIGIVRSVAVSEKECISKVCPVNFF